MKKKTNLEAFRAETDVQDILVELMAEGHTKTDIINESIRQNGHKAALKVLERQMVVAQDKFNAARKAAVEKEAAEKRK